MARNVEEPPFHRYRDAAESRHDLASTGFTFRELLDQIHLQRVMRLIEDDDIRLGYIAPAVGYSDSAHFNRTFHRWTGISPSEYRVQRSADR